VTLPVLLVTLHHKNGFSQLTVLGNRWLAARRCYVPFWWNWSFDTGLW